MNSYKQQIQAWWHSLKPLERRWAVLAGSIAFLIFNWFFIWPHFGDYARNKVRIRVAETTNSFFEKEIYRKFEYQRKLAELQNSGDSDVPPEDQAIDLAHFIQNKAVNNGVAVPVTGQLVTHTNDYFIEQQINITAQAYETNMVKFLYSLGSGSSLMRVRGMGVRPEPNHYQISVNMTLVASYQKKAPERKRTGTAELPASPAASHSSPAAPSAKPSAPAATPPPATAAVTPAAATPALAAPAANPGQNLTPPPPPGNRPPRFQRRGMTNRPPGMIPPP